MMLQNASCKDYCQLFLSECRFITTTKTCMHQEITPTAYPTCLAACSSFACTTPPTQAGWCWASHTCTQKQSRVWHMCVGKGGGVSCAYLCLAKEGVLWHPKPLCHAGGLSPGHSAAHLQKNVWGD